MRERVLAAWAASPARFREDANAEEDLVRGGYRDRVVVELAQNAADAARRAGVAGRLHVALRDGVLVAANTGAPLDAAGVESLSTLRASAKREDAGLAGGPDSASVGRFGVGFAAVLAVTDDPRIASRSGSVRWSAQDARAVVHDVPALRDELARRSGHVPVLRLPWPAEPDPPPEPFTTAVLLPLRDSGAETEVRRLLAEVDDTLLLALPGLEEVVVEVDGRTRTVTDAGRWHVVRRSGATDPGLLADRPVEERARATWSVLWALPLGGQPVPPTVHAPTPTDEPVDLPALLVASLPLEPSRRHVAPGPLTDFLVQEAAAAYADLARGRPDPLGLTPGPVPVGRLDAALRRAIVGALARTPLLTAADGEPVAPADAVAVAGVGAGDPLLAVLADVLPGLVADHRSLGVLGTRRVDLADVVDDLAQLDREPAWWQPLYAAVAGRLSGADRDALASLPVPLADGRLVRGPRGVLVPGGPLPPGLDGLGLRVVHPAAAHPVLLRLGAVEATPRTLLDDPAVRAAVADAGESTDADAVAAAVLGLVEAAAPAPGELPWLGDLLLRDDAGDLVPAADLLLPGSVLAEVVQPDALGVPGDSVLGRWPPRVLAAVGVAADLTVVTDADVPLEADLDHDLADEPAWVDAVLASLPASDLPPVLAELRAVRDLDLVRPDAWPAVLRVLAGDPDLRAAVTEPARVVLPDGGRADAVPYTAWWLRRHAAPGGRHLSACALPDAAGLEGLYEVVDAELAADLDAGFLAALGVRTSVAALLASPGGPDDLLDRLADPDRPVRGDQLRALYMALADVEPAGVSPPLRVRTGPMTVVDADSVVLLDSPAHLQLHWEASLVVPLSVAARLADVLDVRTSSEDVPATLPPGGEPRPVPEAVRELLPAAPARWFEHGDLAVAGSPVDWWLGDDGVVHASTVDGLARGLAWSAGRWDLRHLVGAVLAEPGVAARLLDEQRMDG